MIKIKNVVQAVVLLTVWFSQSAWAEQQYTVNLDVGLTTISLTGTAQDLVDAMQEEMDGLRNELYLKVPKPPSVPTKTFFVVWAPGDVRQWEFSYSLRGTLWGPAHYVSAEYEKAVDEVSEKIIRGLRQSTGILLATSIHPANSGQQVASSSTVSQTPVNAPDDSPDKDLLDVALEIKRNEALGLPAPSLPKVDTAISRADQCAGEVTTGTGSREGAAEAQVVNAIDCLVGDNLFSFANDRQDICATLEGPRQAVCYSLSRKQFEAVPYIYPDRLDEWRILPDTLKQKCRSAINNHDAFEDCLSENGLDMAQHQLDMKDLAVKQGTQQFTRFLAANKDAKRLVEGYEKTKDQYECLQKSKTATEKLNCVSDGHLGNNEQALVGAFDCISKARTNMERVNCAVEGRLGENEQEALRIANCANDSTSYIGMAACASGADLTPEQQVYLDCGATASAGAYAYGACVGGKLTEKELTKCLDKGFGGEGCFGENNFFRQNIENVRRELCGVVGEGSDVCGGLTFVVDNSLMPGENHEVVKYFNQGLNDLKNGPGPNNEFRRAATVANLAIDRMKDEGKKAFKDLNKTRRNAEIAINKAGSDMAREFAAAGEGIESTANKAGKDFYVAWNKAEDDANREINNLGKDLGRKGRETEEKIREGVTDDDGCLKVVGCTTVKYEPPNIPIVIDNPLPKLPKLRF